MTMTQRMAGGTVLLLVLLTATDLRADEAEEKVVQAIQKFGGHVTRDEKTDGKHVVALYLSNGPVTDADLKELAALKQLQKLNLCYTQVTDAGLKELAALKQLQTLDLQSRQVTDAGLKEVAALKQLQLLHLSCPQVTDAGVAEVQKALPKLGICR